MATTARITGRAVLGALGIVFGDIGTSPLYAVRWQVAVFGAMVRLSGSATEYFRLPPGRVVELGSQVHIRTGCSPGFISGRRNGRSRGRASLRPE